MSYVVKDDASSSESIPSQPVSDLNSRADAVRDAQRAIAAEAVLSGTEMIERLRSEVHLWNEFISKLAVSHSVKDFGTMWEECGRHQLEFARRQADLFFDHGSRVIAVTASLLKNAKGNG